MEGAPYFATAVSYTCKRLLKLTTKGAVLDHLEAVETMDEEADQF